MTEEFAIRIKTILENNAIKSVLGPLKRLSKEGDLSAASIAKIGKNALKLGALIGIFALITKGIKTFAKYNEESQAKLQGLTVSTNTLKANFMSLSYTIGSIFAKAINGVLDILTKIVDFIAKAVAYINYFLTALGLGGKSASFFAEQMANAQNKTGGAAKNAKELNKQLAGFDELNNLSKQEDSGGGVAAGAGFPIKEIEISDKFKAITEKIKENLDWISILVSSSALAVGAILLFTGSNIPLGLGLLTVGAIGIGKAITANWNSMETPLGKAFQRIALITGASLLAVGAILILTGAGIPLGLGFILAGAAGMIAAVKVDWDAFATKYVQPFIDGMAKAGQSIIDGFIRPIVDFFVKIYNWLKRNIFDPFIKGLKKLFGISSPSKVMKELGKDIIDGLKNGISNVWESVKEIWTNFKNKISETFENIKRKAQEGWSNVKSAWTGVGNWFESNVGGPIKNTLSNAWNTVKTGAQNGWNNIKNAFSTVGNWFNDNVKGPIANKFREVFENTGVGSVYNFATKGFENLKKGFANVGQWFKDNVTNPANNAINNIQSTKTIDVKLNKTNFSVNVTANNPVIKPQVKLPTYTATTNGSTFNWVRNGEMTMQAYALGTNYVPNDQIALLHKGEAVIPREFNTAQQGSPFVNNEETTDLLERILDVVQTKEFRAVISQSEVGKASTNYIRQQSRVMGGSLV